MMLGRAQMKPLYRHRQSGPALQSALVCSSAGTLVLGLITGGAFIVLPAAVLLAVASWACSSLTVEVSPDELTWFFGPGLFRRHVFRDEILKASPARNKWWWGWGIHLTSRGWLYNVAGLEAVEIVLSDGKTFRIGSDDVSGLTRALIGN